jgi:hypothetical protein
MDNFNRLLEQFTKINIIDVPEDVFELDSDLRYTDHFQHRGLEYIKTKKHITLDDPLIDEILQLEALNIKTPLKEWEDKFGKVEKKKIVKCVKNTN